MGNASGKFVDLIESSGADLPPVGTTRLIRKGGVTQQSVDGAAYAAIGGSTAAGDFEAVYKARASALLGASNLASCFVEFMSGKTSGTFGATGTGDGGATLQDSVDAVNSIGGVIVMNTGATANSTDFWQSPTVAGRAPTLTFNNAAIKFYRAARFALKTAPTANTFCYSGSQNWKMGVIGSASTAKYAVSIGVAEQAHILSSVSIDTGWHVIESWHDGVNAWICVDGETPVSVPSTALFPINGSTGVSIPFFTVGNGATAANQQVFWNWSYWACATS